MTEAVEGLAAGGDAGPRILGAGDRPGASLGSKGGSFFPCFDGYRAIACICVLLTHAAFDSGAVMRHAWGVYSSRLDIGVSIFFLVSGFLLYRPFVVSHFVGSSRPATGPFLWRRAVRIFPAYWLALTAEFFIFHAKHLDSLFGAVTHYGLLQIYSRQQAGRGILQAWSLATEVSFYLFLPLYARLLSGRGHSATTRLRWELGGVVALYAVSVAFRLWVAFAHAVPAGLADAWLPARVDQFSLGMGLAIVSTWTVHRGATGRIFRWIGKLTVLWWALAALTFWVVSTKIGLRRDAGPISTASLLGRQALYGLTAVFLLLPGVFGAQDRGLIRRFLRNRVVQLVGVLSYGIYLWHKMFIEEFFRWFHVRQFEANVYQVAWFALAVSLLAASLSYTLVEAPLLSRYKVWPRFSRLTRRPPVVGRPAETRPERPLVSSPAIPNVLGAAVRGFRLGWEGPVEPDQLGVREPVAADSGG